MATQTGLAQRLREAAQELAADGSFMVADLANQMGVQSYGDLKRVRNAVLDLVRSGELEREAKGLYRWVGKADGKPQLQEVMWRLVRARKTVTVDDLQELSGADRNYVNEFLRRLVRRGVVRKHDNGNFHLIEDPVEMPSDDAKAERLRQLRARKKTAIEALDQAWLAIAEARMAVAELETEPR